MPPKGPRQKGAGKGELVEKVREIKQRQETWFKEREQEKSRSSPTEGHKTTAAPRAIVRQTRTIRKGTDPSQSPVPNLPDATDVRPGGFQNYLQRKHKAEQNATAKSVGSSSVDGSVYQDGSVWSEQTSTDNQRLLSRSQKSSLSPEMFDTLADQIINKVKREMHKDNVINSRSPSRDPCGSADCDVSRSGHQEAAPTQEQSNNTNKLSSHHCQICAQLMLAPNNSPQLLIPCGHTFCLRCCTTGSTSSTASSGDCRMTYCPVCGTEVQTMTPNIMLQQLIAEYAADSGRSTTTGNSRGGTPSSRTSSRNQQAKPAKARDLSGEFDTLTVRCEVLEAEADDIRERMDELERRADLRLQDADDILRQEQLIEQQVEQLRQKQQALMEEREAIIEDSESIRDLVREEEAKLHMVTTTIQGLRKDMKKIKRLANGTPR